jgi:hypothetical protein
MLRSMYHQAFVTGLHDIPSHCCLHPPFWSAPAAHDYVLGVPHVRVVMAFVCVPDVGKLFREGNHEVAEQALERYKLCVRQVRCFLATLLVAFVAFASDRCRRRQSAGKCSSAYVIVTVQRNRSDCMKGDITACRSSSWQMATSARSSTACSC